MSLKRLVLMDVGNDANVWMNSDVANDSKARTNETTTLPWSRNGHQVATYEDDQALLSGWYRVVSWFLSFTLSEPQDALFLRKLQPGTSLLDAMDLYFQFEPRMFLMYLIGVVYSIMGIFGCAAYVYLRRQGRRDGDRPQDLSYNVTAPLQLSTAVQALVMSCIMLGYVIMLISVSEINKVSTKNGHAVYINQVRQYIENASKSIQLNCVRRKDTFDELYNTMLYDFDTEMYEYALRIVEYQTRDVPESRVVSALQLMNNVRPLRHQNNLSLASQSAVPRTKEEVRQFITRLVVQRIHAVHNSTFIEAAALAHETSLILERFMEILKYDSKMTIQGIIHMGDEISEVTIPNILSSFEIKSVYYAAATTGLFTVLLIMAAGYTGLMMIISVAMSFPISSALMFVTSSVMILATTVTIYVCNPYSKIIHGEADVTHVALLDDTMSYLWPEQKRGKWFGKFLAGTVLEKCNGGRLFDVILDDFDDAINNFINRTNIIQHLLASLTVDPRQILQGDPPQKPQVYYENMKMLIWDDLDDVRGHMLEGFINKLMHSISQRDLHPVNPHCYAAYEGYAMALRLVCSGMIRNANAFWTSLGLCLWLLLLMGIVTDNASKFFIRPSRSSEVDVEVGDDRRDGNDSRCRNKESNRKHQRDRHHDTSDAPSRDCHVAGEPILLSRPMDEEEEEDTCTRPLEHREPLFLVVEEEEEGEYFSHPSHWFCYLL
ncbi:uncharacterized protein LOC135387720 [Ornithodoros turicata]|uniref:uncharacterized protein LOC135387720 n=1 Tax=Ornithodoros turicata TaxID=34597 RepID=UPI0031395560